MNHIQCPKCGEVFKVDESSYAELLNQVRNHEFEKEVTAKLKDIQDKKEQERKLALSEQEKTYQKKILDLESQLSNFEKEKVSSLALQKAEQEASFKETKAKLEAELIQLKQSFEHKAVLEKADYEKRIAQLEAKLDNKELENKMALEASGKEKDSKISELANQIQLNQQSYDLKIAQFKNEEELLLKQKDEEISFYKDLKARMSTKMVGENLEQHCLNQFNSIRAVAFPKAYFEKDNEVSSTGSKGDFIYRETDENGIEIISIMFEMKNENETTSTKHKNEDFFKELDKDRHEKGCEYAILVSMLEGDSELYNQGIVDVSHRYPKMYVIRPQFFIPMISLLRNAALNSLEYKVALKKSQDEHLDLLNFENEMQNFKDDFSRNFGLAKNKFDKAIEEIDKTIADLEKVKESLTASTKQLGYANNKAQDLSIKKLTKNSPSLREEFKSIEANKKEEK